MKALPEKQYYKIGEVAKAFDVNASLIRFWEGEFDVIKPKKNKKGNRMFTQQDIKNFRIIFNLVKVRGFTLQGAKNYFKNNRYLANKNQEILSRLEFVRAELVKLKEQLG